MTEICLNKEKALSNLLTYFFEHQIIIKMFHFQTTDYAAHKATDVYLAGFLIQFDRFMEVAQGIKEIGGEERKVKMDGIELKTEFAKSTDGLINYLDEFVDRVNSAMKGDDSKCRGLAAIRDEIIADAQKLVYLLKFK